MIDASNLGWKYSLLLLFLPGVYFLSRSWLKASKAGSVNVLTPGVAIALWVLATHFIGLLTHSYGQALISSTVGLGSLGFFLAFKSSSWRRPSPRKTKMKVGVSFWVLLAVSIFAGKLVLYRFHDVEYSTGHYSMISFLQNGTYPLKVIPFQDTELRYHYGFDVLCANVSALIRINSDHSIFVVAPFLLAYFWLLLCALGVKINGEKKGLLTAFLVFFAGGFNYLGAPLFPNKPRIQNFLMSWTKLDGESLFPPVISYFYQYPFAFGFPLACVILLLLCSEEPERRETQVIWSRAALFCTLLVSLGFFHSVLFGCCCLATLIAVLLRYQSDRSSKYWQALALGIIVAGALTYFSHGMFLHTQDGRITKHFLPNLRGNFTLRWVLACFGLYLPVGLLGLSRMRHGLIKTILSVGIFFSFVTLNFVNFTVTGDIVKFGIVCLFFLALCSAATLRQIAEISLPRFAVRSLQALILLFCILTGIDYVAARWLRPVFPFLEAIPAEINIFGKDRNEYDALRFLRRNVKAPEVVFRRKSLADQYTIYGGLATTFESFDGQFAIPSERVAARRKIFTEELPASLDELTSQDVRWIVVDDGESVNMSRTNLWAHQGELTQVARFGPIHIFRTVEGNRQTRAPSYSTGDRAAGSTLRHLSSG